MVFLYLHKLLNMAAINFDTFCVSLDYVMPNSWKYSRHITDDSSCYLYSCQKILLCLHLNDTCGNRWIGHGSPIAWPSRSTDLTPLDFHFWRYIKILVYATPGETQHDLVARIQVAAGVIRDMSRIFPRVRYDIIWRYTKCIEVGGGHIEHLLCLLTIFQLSPLLLS